MSHFNEDFDSLVAKTPLSDGLGRRDFIKTALGTGFAAAVLPVSAQTIHTDTAGLTAGEVMLKVGDTSVPVYRAQPAGKSNLPVVLVVQEVFGVHEYIADTARRFARAGYLAVAPELYARQGDPSTYNEIGKLIAEIVNKVPDEQVMADLDGAAKWAGANGGNPQKVGITGFCWGGRITWLYAAHSKNVKAAVAWYGRLVGDSTPLTPQHPVDVAALVKAPVLGLYGGKDGGIPLESIEKMKAALAKGSSKSEFVVYPNSGHAFHADYRPSYVEADAKDGWRRCLAWFKANGVA